jgi:hypothetical protein
MSFGAWFFTARWIVIAGILAISLTAKIPSSKCHCQDPVKSQKELCPFGVLRNLAMLEPRIETPKLFAFSSLFTQALSDEFGEILLSRTTPSFSARAPPLT